MMANSVKEFHEHLDACDQCKEQPMRLCEIGDRLLKLAASDDGPRVALYVNFYGDSVFTPLS